MRGHGHDLTSIVDTALGLLDEFGLPDLTMRRLAAALDVRPSALYWHVENKQSLLAAIADRIVGEAGPATGVAETARAIRRAILSHRDGAEVVIGTRALALGSDPAHALLRDALARTGSADPSRDASVLEQFLLGHASLVQQRIQAAAIGAYDADPRDVDERALADFDAGIRALTP
ncbi:TetR family transcriptional regulator [Microbacterium karelineae]|uniref:TetR family transcriptional regulator n=1 Tax=Microbacterium karelineae TaxID=2654283 RepID=UPI0012EA9F6C|nr:TetR family transcriptional regulator [Microbacterium karelineae]